MGDQVARSANHGQVLHSLIVQSTLHSSMKIFMERKQAIYIISSHDESESFFSYNQDTAVNGRIVILRIF
jgi:hypothetical protein